MVKKRYIFNYNEMFLTTHHNINLCRKVLFLIENNMVKFTKILQVLCRINI